MLSLLRENRPFTIFLVSQGISNVGDGVRLLIVPLLVLQLTHSPALAAGVALIGTISYLVLRFPLGALLDRWDRWRAMLVADLARAVLTLVVPLVAALHGPVLPVLYIVALPLSIGACVFGAGVGAFVPALAGREHVGKAYSLTETLESVAYIIGPLLGGLLAVAWGGANALAVDGVSFLVSALGLVLIRGAVTQPPTVRAPGIWDSVVAGLRFIVGNRLVRRIQLSWTLYGVLGPAPIALGLVYVGSHAGHSTSLFVALPIAVYNLGSAAGTLLAGVWHPSRPWRAMGATMAALGVGALLIASGALLAILAGAALFGLGGGLFLILALTRQAQATPDDLMGRVTSSSAVLARLSDSLGLAWFGLALQWLQGPGAFVLVGVLGLLLAGWMGLRPPPETMPAAVPEVPALGPTGGSP